jgi:hypothetical protein
MTACNTSRTNSCTGGTDTCGPCGNGQNCSGSNLCQNNLQCSFYGANGQPGNDCSNGPNPNWPNMGGTNLTCPCYGGGQCVSGGMVLPNGSTMQGTCCVNSNQCTPGTCNTSVTDSCTGATIPCTCDNQHYCSGTTCVPKNNCGSLGKTGKVGSGCNDNNFYPDGSGDPAGNFPCHCDPSGGYANIVCSGESTSVEGTCACTPSACADCTQDGQANGCGGNKSCACSGTANKCYPAAGGPNGCCAPNTCSNPPAGVPAPGVQGGACAFSDGCGSSVSCGCPTTNPMTGKPINPKNETCTPVSGSNPAYSKCGCTASTCQELGGFGVIWPNDGCGEPRDCRT